MAAPLRPSIQKKERFKSVKGVLTGRGMRSMKRKEEKTEKKIVNAVILVGIGGNMQRINPRVSGISEDSH